jgi:NAD-dependent SIR2 family protein deacetylase
MDQESIKRAAEAIAAADGVLIGAGAGMGVDSGLPDFRGDEGFWRAYPPFAKLGLSFIDMASPQWFERDPALAWGFYGHRLNLYRATSPHAGFSILARWAEGMERGAFVFTSNVDGQFQRAGYTDARVVECHGSIHHLQCSAPCGSAIWDAAEAEVEVDESSFRAAPPFPSCPRCGEVARPNILMFGDWGWHGERSSTQEARLRDWFAEMEGGRLVIVECGAGCAVPTVRWQSEQVSARHDATLIRINPRESEGPAGTISIATGALEALEAIDHHM